MFLCMILQFRLLYTLFFHISALSEKCQPAQHLPLDKTELIVNFFLLERNYLLNGVPSTEVLPARSTKISMHDTYY